MMGPLNAIVGSANYFIVLGIALAEFTQESLNGVVIPKTLLVGQG